MLGEPSSPFLRGRIEEAGDNSDCRNKYGDYIGFGFQTCFRRLFVIVVRRGVFLGCPLPPVERGLGGIACRKSGGTVRDGHLPVFERGAEGCEDCLSPVAGVSVKWPVFMSFFFCGGRLTLSGEVRLFGDDARSGQLIAIVPGCELSAWVRAEVRRKAGRPRPNG